MKAYNRNTNIELLEYKARVRDYVQNYTSRELRDMLIKCCTNDEALRKAYQLKVEEEEKTYREENETKLWAFYEKHKDEPKHSKDGETWWDFFSDWHKDIYGIRPY